MHLGSLLERTEIHIRLIVSSEVRAGKEQYGVALKKMVLAKSEPLDTLLIFPWEHSL